MDAACLAALERGGRSELAITTYRPPRGWQLVVAVWIAGMMGIYAVEKLAGEGWSVSGLLGLGEGGQWWFGMGLRTAFWLVVVAHVGESVGVMLPLLWRYNVKVGTGRWWLWAGSHAVEGWGAVMRFRGMVREEEGKRAKEGKRE